ncbi:MAG TPA: sensor domain-containing protein [Mycobacterium sp.]|nr:sensor domain-containing protein [Mycobacterium sp.]
MRIRGIATALLAVAALATGCGGVVAGTAKPAANLKPGPLSGATVKQVLLDGATLSRMLNQTFVARDPAEFGGPEKLYQVKRSSQAGCLGVTAMLQQGVYRAADVKDVAAESWWNNGEPAQVIVVEEGVVTLPSATQAGALFAQFSEQWQQCNGMTTSEQSGPISTTNVISDVRATDSTIAATKTATSILPNMPPLRPTPQARAIGIRSNCLVEVQVVFFGGRRSSDPGSADINSSAIDVARALMDKVSALG